MGAGDSTTPHDASARPAAPFQPGVYFGGYEILEELGRGGMGVVYKARQLTPERLVALKVIRTDRLEGLSEQERRQWIERFQRKAQLVAGLEQHPNIVTLYEVGDHEGQPYFTMQLVAGGSLAQRLRPPPSPYPLPQSGGEGRVRGDAAAADRRLRGQRDNARLLALAARAVDYAHRRGVLHRDLKPGNILLDADGRPLVGDFGLARRLDETGSLVASGIEGTAAYMAPEQARAAKGAMTTAADVYGLGAILYETLTGRPPFRGNNDLETLLSVLDDEPLHPCTVDRRLSRDLATVCLKCLEKEPSRRYALAAALAVDLDNWLAGRPINARPVGAPERLWRWCRRQPALAAAVGLAAGALLAGTVISTLFGFHWRCTANDLADAVTAKEGQRTQAVQAADQLRKEQRTTRRMTAGLTLDAGLHACADGDPGLGLLRLAQGLEIVPEDSADLQEELRANLAGWRRTLAASRDALPHRGVVAAAGFSLDGRRLLTLSTGTLRTMDGDGGNGQKRRTMFFPETLGDELLEERVSGRRPLDEDIFGQPKKVRRPATSGGHVLVWDAATGKPIEAPLPPDLRALAFSPDGHTILTEKRQNPVVGPSIVQLWDLTAAKPIGRPTEFPNGVRVAVFGPDGKTVLLAGGDEHFIRSITPAGAWAELWDAATGDRLPGIDLPGVHLGSVSFSPDGKVLALAASYDRRIPHNPLFSTDRGGDNPGRMVLYDLAQRKQLIAPLEYNLDADAAVAVGPGGRMVLTVRVADGIIGTLDGVKGCLWDLDAKQGPRVLQLDGPTTFAAFSPDGKTLLTACDRGRFVQEETIQLWDVASARPLGPPLRLRGALCAAAFSPDGRLLVTAGGERTEGEAQLWDVASARPLGRAFQHSGIILTAAFSPDGKTVVTGGADGAARLWAAEPFRPLAPLVRLDRVAAFSADGGLALVRDGGDTLRLHETATGKALGEPVPFSDKGGAVVLSPDNHTVLIAYEGKTARLWDALTGRPVGDELAHIRPVKAMHFSRDGKTAMTIVPPPGRQDEPPDIYLWDAATGHSLGFEKDPRLVQAELAESPDGRNVLWAADYKVLMQNVDPHRASPTATNAVPNRSYYAQVQDADTHRAVGKQLWTDGPVTAALFSPDGQTVLTVSSRSGSWEEARLWEVATGEPLGPPLQHLGLIRAMAFSPDGKYVATGGEDKIARVWTVNGGQPVGPPLPHAGGVLAVAFSPDDKTLATGCEDGAVRLWHTTGGKLLGPPMPHQGPVSFVKFGPEGRKVVSGGDGKVCLWEVPVPPAGTVSEVVLWAQVVTGMELEDGVARPLDLLEWTRRRQQLKDLGGPTP